MLKKKKTTNTRFSYQIFSIFLISSLIFSQYCFLFSSDNYNEEKDGKNAENSIVMIPNSSLDAPITIVGDDWTGFSGSGGSDSPFIIENLVIDGDGSIGIAISSSTLYFEIRNCTIYDVDRGISLDNVEAGTAKIYNNTIYSCRGTATLRSGIGLYLYGTNGVKIYENVIYDIVGSTGIYSGNGISMHGSHSNLVENNLIYDINSGSGSEMGFGNGIYLVSSQYNQISNNQISECSSGSQPGEYSGNGICDLHGDYNEYVNNTITEISGGNGKISGNGIAITNWYGKVGENKVINNSISNVVGGNAYNSGNGILLRGQVDYLVESTIVQNNYIENCHSISSADDSAYGGCGIAALHTKNTSLLNNIISNCSAIPGSWHAGNGILSIWTENSIFSQNVIDFCMGYSYLSGNGIACFSGDYLTISSNNISNTQCNGSGATDCGNGILISNSYKTQITNNRIVNPQSGTGRYSGNGIYLKYEFTYGYIRGNTVVGCTRDHDARTGWGVLGSANFDCNQVSYNEVGSSGIGLKYRDSTSYRNNYNTYLRNTADEIYLVYGDFHLVQDNTVNFINMYSSSENVFVGNLRYNGDAPEFDFRSGSKSDHYYLRIISPGASGNYRGCGGMRLNYKYQYFGHELEEIVYWQDGIADKIHRPYGEVYIPWKTGSHSIYLTAKDTISTEWDYESKSVSYSLEYTGSSDVIQIYRNKQEGGIDDPFALSYWDTSFSGDGTANYPYEIKDLNIEIPADSPLGTAGISISNTDSYFILKNCTISGGVGHYGISLMNVINARIEDCTIIGIPSTYIPNDETAASHPIERGIFIDENSENNTITNCIIYRTLSSGIRVEGNNNYFYSNIIANAQCNGITISGNENIVSYNEIAPFGGPDFNDYHYLKGVTNNNLIGLLIDDSGSENEIKNNKFSNFPTAGINITESFCCDNVIVANEFTSCSMMINDLGTNTQFIKISTPLDGQVYTGNNPLYDGYYSGTEGFQDIAIGELPLMWSLNGTGTDYKAEIISEKTDLYGFEHKQVLECYSGVGIDPYVEVQRTFSQNYSMGTIEFWIMKKGDSSGNANITFQGNSGVLFSLLLENEEFSFTDNTTVNESSQEFHDEFWYRVVIEFLNNGTYSNLGEQQYQFRIYNMSGDGLLYTSDIASFSNDGNITSIDFLVHGSDSNDLSLYFDAFGYSWNPSYRLGNNAFEGMLISQLIQQDYKDWEWMGYVLNYGDVIECPFLSDFVIPLPNTLGKQSLQLLANDSADFQTISPVVEFSHFFDRKICVLEHHENNELVAEFTQLTGRGILKLDPATPLNITIAYNTEKDGSYTYTNASFFYRICGESWETPFITGNQYGYGTLNYILMQGNYSLGDTIDYFIKFQQYDISGKFIQQYYWTQSGVEYFEKFAVLNAFHKKVSPIPYQLTLNYSAFYQAEKTRNITSTDGYDVSISGMAPIAQIDFDIHYQNTTNDMTHFQAIFDGYVSSMNHIIRENNCLITESETYPPITENLGYISPFLLPFDSDFEEQESTILFPNMLFNTNEPNEENRLIFTREILNLTYKGVKTDWFYGKRNLREFERLTEDTFTCIRFDYYTGIMVYFNYNDFTEGASKRIFFGLNDNNQSYPINLKIEMREELNDTDQDFVNMTLDGILYDPPGDGSFTEMSAGTSVTTGWTLETQAGEDYQKEFQYLIYGFGSSTEEYEIDTTGDVYEFEMTRTYTHSLSSSKDETNSALIGPGRGDLYYGSGTYIFYYFYVNNFYFVINQSDPVNFPYDDILVLTVGSRIEYSISPNTSFSVLGAHLEDSGMNEIYYENVFEDNEISGAECHLVTELDYSPLYWTAGGTNEFGYSSSSSNMAGLHSYMEFSNDSFFVWSQSLVLGKSVSIGDMISIGYSVEVTALESSGKIATLNTWSRDFLSYETTTSEEQILVHLEDDDGAPLGQHDQFNMRIFNDTRYNTIGFLIDEDGTYTSDPHEQFTGDRRPPSSCEFYGIADYLSGIVPLNVLAFDEELDVLEANNIWKVNFYYDDDPIFGIDSIFIDVHGEPEKSVLDDPEEFGVLWDCSLLQGQYYIFAEAWDYGTPMPNNHLSEPYQVFIDNADPTICEVIAYAPFCNVIPLFACADDLETDIGYVEYWDGDPNLEESILLGWSDVKSDSYRFLWATDPGKADYGIHNIFAKAFDLAGNSLLSSPKQINVTETTLPTDTSPQDTTLPDNDESDINWQTTLMTGGMAAAGGIIAVILVFVVSKMSGSGILKKK